MATFLQNSLSQLNNGYQQVYGQPAVAATPATPVSYPTAPVAAPVSVNPNVAGSPDMPVMVPVSQLLSGAPVGGPTPMAYNPEVGAPAGAGSPDPHDEAHRLYRRANESAGGEDEEFWRQLYLDHLNKHFPGHIERSMSGGPPTPISRNPEVGQPLGASTGGDSSAGLTSWLQNFFASLGVGGQQQQPVSTNAPTLLNPDTQVGPATPTLPQAPQTVGGDVGVSPAINQANASNTSLGGMGGGGGGSMGGSILSGIGSGLSSAGKSTSAAQSTFTPPNIPLPKPIQFMPPNLSPNTKASY